MNRARRAPPNCFRSRCFSRAPRRSPIDRKRSVSMRGADGKRASRVRRDRIAHRASRFHMPGDAASRQMHRAGARARRARSALARRTAHAYPTRAP
ncbi:hypothetical protein AQ731_10105 [Burkholderia pseudomallei]|nr:hypothetical protein AMS56_22125 [Burkholderia pseudomallei]ANW58768.1 hypothetical protein A7U59_21900 [Burkholderia pseudomallei]OMR14052.1 hypothetical protein AQ719_20265 [Burkholderia pseudomallei]OMR42197.1 hypothetical protein AQ724_09560 [Burkholderia pseudomallei]OMS00586.1 hypothetical protein AQ731_10105 [Burkholderia pseudomallei]